MPGCYFCHTGSHSANMRLYLQEGRVAYLSLYDLEKALDSVEHNILLQSLYQASINGKAWRLIKARYGNLTAVVKSGSSLSHPFPVTHGIQQGSVLSPTFFLIVMDKLLHQLRELRRLSSVVRITLLTQVKKERKGR